MKTYFKEGEFKDYKGLNRKFTICGVLTDKYFRIGISIVHPTDVYNSDLGKQIAYGKAMCERSQLVRMSDISRFITDDVAKLILEEESKNVINYPEKYINGYYKSMMKYRFDAFGGNDILSEIEKKSQEINDLHNELKELYYDMIDD